MPNWKKVLLNGSDGSLSTLSLTGISAQNSETDVLTINGSNVVGTRTLGSNAFTSTTIGTTTNNLTVDNTTIQLNSGTTFNGSGARTISAKTATVSETGTGLATGAQIFSFVTNLGYGTGTVDTTGTPANNQIATFTDANTVEGTSNFTYDSSTKELLLGPSSAGNTESNTLRIQGYNSSNPAMLKLGWNNYGGAAFESGFGGNLNIYNFGTSATAGGRVIIGQAGDTGTNQTNYLWIRGDNADDSTHIYMGANSTTYSSEIGIERQEGTGVNYESDIALRAAAGTNGHKSEYIFSRKGMFQAQDAGFTVSGSGQVFVNITASLINPTTKLSGFDQALVVNGTITASAFQGDGSQLTGVGTLTGNGTSTRVPFYNGTTSFTTNAGFVYTDGSKRLELTGDGSNAPLRISNLTSPDSSQVVLVVDSENNDDIQKRTLGSNAFTSTTIPTNNNQLTNGAGYIDSLSGAVLTTGAQTVAGVKTFSSQPVFSSGINIGSTSYALFVYSSLLYLTAPAGVISIGGGPGGANNDLSIPYGSLGVGNISPSSTNGRIDASNDVVAYSTSDKKLKENIKPIKNALNKVSQISGVEFDWKKLSKEEKKTIHSNKGHDVGVIAQEIEEVLPEVVTTRDNSYKAVKYEKIVPLLIEAIKELQAEVQELKNSK